MKEEEKNDSDEGETREVTNVTNVRSGGTHAHSKMSLCHRAVVNERLKLHSIRINNENPIVLNTIFCELLSLLLLGPVIYIQVL